MGSIEDRRAKLKAVKERHLNDEEKLVEVTKEHYRYIHTNLNGRNEPRWRGTRVVKFPQDLILYAQVIFKRTPDYIIETGTHFGGSALFFGDMLELTGGKKVFSIDISHSHNPPPHPRVEHILGSSIDPKIVEYVRSQIPEGAEVMASFDSSHRCRHVLQELRLYKDIITPGQYAVVEDCWTRHDEPFWPYPAVQQFLKENKNWHKYDIERQFIYAVTRGGWLRRLR